MALYTCGIVYVLSELNVWNVGQLKNTLVWFFTVAIVSVFQIEKIKEDRRFFKHSVLDSFKLLAVVVFIIGKYTFSIFGELILLPVLTLLVLMSEFSAKDKNHSAVKNLIDWILSGIGFYILAYIIFKMITDFSQIANEQTIYDFFIPPLLTLFFLPFVFALLVYSTYENVLTQTQFAIKHKGHRLAAKLLAMVFFNVRIELLERWSGMLHLQTISSYRDVLSSILKIFEMRSAEKKPKEVNINDGWSPYTIKDSLISEGIKTGYYKELYDDGEWFSSSPPLEMGEGILPNNIAFYIEGNKDAAKSLKLVINVNNPEDAKLVHDRFIGSGIILCEKAIGDSVPEWLIHSLNKQINITKQIGDFLKVSIQKEIFTNRSNNGYRVTLKLENVS